MTHSHDDAASKRKRLRDGMIDLIGVFAISAAGAGQEPADTFITLLDVLVPTRRPDFACGRLNASVDAAALDLTDVTQVTRERRRIHPASVTLLYASEPRQEATW